MSISRDSFGPRAAASTNRNVSAYRRMSVTRSRYRALDAFSTYTAPGSGAGNQDAVLLTSELVTNTLQHTATGTGGDFEVIACHGPDRITVTVTDDGSPGWPELAPRAALATSGQGLMLVEALADRWGHHGNQRARTVWFELACR
jgi:Histidine kinase-like ATPase domain